MELDDLTIGGLGGSDPVELGTLALDVLEDSDGTFDPLVRFPASVLEGIGSPSGLVTGCWLLERVLYGDWCTVVVVVGVSVEVVDWGVPVV